MTRLPPTARDMVSTFQCPGCVHNQNEERTNCGHFKLQSLPNATPHNNPDRPLVGGMRCSRHETDVRVNGGGLVNIGLPIPFARVQYRQGADEVRTNIRMHLYPVNYGTYWDAFNIAVWALEKNGVLFVRTYVPRIDQSYVDIINEGSISQVLAAVPGCIDIGPIAEQIRL